ncbi:MAG: alginate export family protein [Hyphomonadaceae bacterium]
MKRLRRASLFFGALAACVSLPARAHAQEATGADAGGADDAVKIETWGLVRLGLSSWNGYLLGPATPVGNEDVALVRALADLKATWPEGPELHVQMAYHEQIGRRVPIPADHSSFDIQLASLDLPIGDNTKLRIGRQQIYFGSRRIFALRDGANISRAYDGVLVDHEDGPLHLRAFAVRPVKLGPDPFDDVGDENFDVLGAHATVSFDEGRGIDLYALDYSRERSVYPQGLGPPAVGPERRYSVGARVFDTRAPFDWNIELTRQWGEFAGDEIDAHMIAAEAGVTLADAPGAPRIALKGIITTGDSDPNDDRLETFNAYFSGLYELGHISIFAPLNYIDLEPSVRFELAPRVSLLLRGTWQWREEEADAIYIGGPFAVPAAPLGQYVARQLDVEFDFNATESLRVHLGYSHVHVGRSVRAQGGEPLDHFAMMLVQRF